MTALEPPSSAVLPAGMYTPWAVPYPAVLPAAASGKRSRWARMAHYLRGDRALPQLGRFALVGGASNITYVLLFAAMYGMGSITANIAGSAVSTVIANELHRRLTFKAADRVHWFTAQWEAGGLALLGLVITTGALAALEVFTPTLGGGAQAAAVMAITAAVGGMRFLALRGFVF
ncbi:MAG TPA: GtrA family protein [Nocardia sp.]|uniref:GtrA family protein n=1 Tax=Nocardia sp. TaxID=1821 RepID=UPI002B4AB1DB|nr:GtrA family protein [Nocardia sp.]HLS78515.1 GtrA family protein [Nocardia sp.]